MELEIKLILPFGHVPLNSQRSHLKIILFMPGTSHRIYFFQNPPEFVLLFSFGLMMGELRLRKLKEVKGKI